MVLIASKVETGAIFHSRQNLSLIKYLCKCDEIFHIFVKLLSFSRILTCQFLTLLFFRNL